ncbi:hypothetical protein PG994_005895 [Apiospora phragmitis]|uniref:Cystathionine gamma-synthase n=1 Tax=Apiospora phragmitis TaxID=2905665 RepID=A0ABR1VDI2_9PEZI
MPSFGLGESIPSDTAHAVSVSLPTWKANVGYEEGQQWVVDKMVTGYPRFFIHKSIQALASDITSRFGQSQQQAMLFPTRKAAQRCYTFIQEKAPKELQANLHTIDLVLSATASVPPVLRSIAPSISAVLFVPDAFPVAKQYWQHSGDGVSSRRAEFCHGLLRDGLLVLAEPSQAPRSPGLANAKVFRGPRRYQRPASIDATNGSNHPSTASQGGQKNGSPSQGSDPEIIESSRFLEERFGRNLDLSLVSNAKSAIRRRIAGVLSGDVDLTTKLPTMDSTARGVNNFREDDIYLTPCGMNAIFTAHQTLLKILQKFGPGAVFYGRASFADLDDLEEQLKSGARFLALFCEFPGNPLLACPDLVRIRKLANEYDFAVVIDETIGTFVNVNVLPYADVVVSSLTKIFSGDCNVMGGGLVLNPGSRYYSSLKQVLNETFEDKNYWAEDVMFMERNSRDFKTRIDRVNTNAEAICDVLAAHPNVLNVYYPKFNDSRPNYEACKTPQGGYGGLLSCTLKNKEQAIAFYDALDTAKGPSLGTNFTLTSPYVLLAHYQELDWAASYGVDPSLVRVSVGLEETELLKLVFAKALKATEEVTAEAK